jgi:hypothetical protein
LDQCLGLFWFPPLLLIRKRWSLILVRSRTNAAALVWVYTTIHLVQEPMISSGPWSGAVIILSSVALFSVLAGLLLNARKVKERYPSSEVCELKMEDQVHI